MTILDNYSVLKETAKETICLLSKEMAGLTSGLYKKIKSTIKSYENNNDSKSSYSFFENIQNAMEDIGVLPQSLEDSLIKNI